MGISARVENWDRISVAGKVSRVGDVDLAQMLAQDFRVINFLMAFNPS